MALGQERESMKDLGQKFRENTQNVEFANIGLSVMKMQKMLGVYAI